MSGWTIKIRSVYPNGLDVSKFVLKQAFGRAFQIKSDIYVVNSKAPRPERDHYVVAEISGVTSHRKFFEPIREIIGYSGEYSRSPRHQKWAIGIGYNSIRTIGIK